MIVMKTIRVWIGFGLVSGIFINYALSFEMVHSGSPTTPFINANREGASAIAGKPATTGSA